MEAEASFPRHERELRGKDRLEAGARLRAMVTVPSMEGSGAAGEGAGQGWVSEKIATKDGSVKPIVVSMGTFQAVVIDEAAEFMYHQPSGAFIEMTAHQLGASAPGRELATHVPSCLPW
uniref:Uncharacterized protein n=1 Tax=Compsopogon caeruleus TaxID=31354 RepID=A0A7S1XAB3_9RHOD